MVATEQFWQIHGQRIAGLHWGKPGGIKVLALHGWLDNAASFIRLAPLLDQCEVVALDLPGHGHSDHRSADASYHLWDDLPDVMAVADQLSWNKFALMGHSRGAIISTLLASAIPERISHLALLDAIMPGPIKHSQTSTQLRQYILDKKKHLHRTHKLIASMDEAIERRCIAARMSHETAKPIVERNLNSEKEGIRWSTDPRLHGASAFKLTDLHIQAVMDTLSVPCRLLLAEDGLGAKKIKAAVEEYPNIVTRSIPGSHHFHLESSATAIAEIFSEFLR